MFSDSKIEELTLLQKKSNKIKNKLFPCKCQHLTLLEKTTWPPQQRVYGNGHIKKKRWPVIWHGTWRGRSERGLVAEQFHTLILAQELQHGSETRWMMLCSAQCFQSSPGSVSQDRAFATLRAVLLGQFCPLNPLKRAGALVLTSFLISFWHWGDSSKGRAHA